MEYIKTNLGTLVITQGENGVEIGIIPETNVEEYLAIASVDVHPDNKNCVVVQTQTFEDKVLRTSTAMLTRSDLRKHYPRFTVGETSDAFTNPFAVIDNTKADEDFEKYVSLNGVIQTFAETEKDEAERFAQKLNELDTKRYYDSFGNGEYKMLSAEELVYRHTGHRRRIA